jgi:Na+/glutamate symporter
MRARRDRTHIYPMDVIAVASALATFGLILALIAGLARI